MRSQWKRSAACLFVFGLALAPLAPAAAQEATPEPKPGPEEESPSQLARESLEQMMRAMRLLVESIPQYELPEVLENGDIIIRRKRDGAAPGEEPEFDETAT